MSDIKPFNTIFQKDIDSITKDLTLNETKGDSKFETALKEAFNQVNSIQKEADRAVESLSSGGDVTDAVLAMEKANMSFQLMVEVRNKLLNAYEEVMRMQV
ncbi:Flagellar hook-basal body complex protein FliE [Candidatus Magnetoovum chiemensis]|nr:Flagellar hook-basal body complex protein FliE [Candidatus Magnetoovum chiemensis]